MEAEIYISLLITPIQKHFERFKEFGLYYVYTIIFLGFSEKCACICISRFGFSLFDFMLSFFMYVWMI